MFCRLVPNHQTACKQIPLNMLSLPPNTKALCSCDNFSLPPLIKCFAKLPEKCFPFDSQQPSREQGRQKMASRLACSLPSLPTCWLGCLCERRPKPPCTNRQRPPAPVISASNRDGLCRIRVLGPLFPRVLSHPGWLNLSCPFPQFITELGPEGDL